MKGHFFKNEFCGCSCARDCGCEVYFPMYASLRVTAKRARVYVIPTGYTKSGFTQRPNDCGPDVLKIMRNAMRVCKLENMSTLAICCLGDKKDEPPDSRRMVQCTGFRQECQDTVLDHPSGHEHVVSVFGHWMWRIQQWEKGRDPGVPLLPGHPKYMSDFVDSAGHGPDYAFAVVLFCRSGRHRSVAWASILMTVLRAYGYVPELDMSATVLRGTCEGKCPACDCKPICSKDVAMTVYEEIRTWAADAQQVHDDMQAKRAKR